MKTLMIAASLVLSSTAFAGISSIEKMVSKKTTETFAFKDGSYKRIAMKMEGKEKTVSRIDGQEEFEDQFSYPGNVELMDEKYITAGENEVEMRIVVPATDGFEGFENSRTIPAKISSKNGKISSLEVSAKFMEKVERESAEMSLKDMLAFSFPEGEVNMDDIQIEKMKIKQSPIKCLPKGNKLYCQRTLKLHAVAVLEK